MTLLKLSPHFTKDSNRQLAQQSHSGQAHFAGTGPENAHCWTCERYSPSKSKSGVVLRNSIGDLKHGRCQKYQELTGRAGNLIPPLAGACKYYEIDRNPEPLKKVKR